MSVRTPCMHCGARYHADYEDGLIECRDRLEEKCESLAQRALDAEQARDAHKGAQ